MPPLLHEVFTVVVLGMGATAVMDLWLLLLMLLKVSTPSFRFIGRWAGHWLRGRWAHDSIAAAPPIRGELALGWLVHYAVGIAFAAVLVAIFGIEWTRHPTFPAAMAVGLGSVVAPLLVVQPALGAGIASSRTPAPLKNCLRNVVNHAVFGAGLYIAGLCIASVTPPL